MVEVALIRSTDSFWLVAVAASKAERLVILSSSDILNNSTLRSLASCIMVHLSAALSCWLVDSASKVLVSFNRVLRALMNFLLSSICTLISSFSSLLAASCSVKEDTLSESVAISTLLSDNDCVCSSETICWAFIASTWLPQVRCNVIRHSTICAVSDFVISFSSINSLLTVS